MIFFGFSRNTDRSSPSKSNTASDDRVLQSADSRTSIAERWVYLGRRRTRAAQRRA
jgi:hypothetical protein